MSDFILFLLLFCTCLNFPYEQTQRILFNVSPSSCVASPPPPPLYLLSIPSSASRWPPLRPWAPASTTRPWRPVGPRSCSGGGRLKLPRKSHILNPTNTHTKDWSPPPPKKPVGFSIGGNDGTQPILVSLWAHTLSVATLVVVSDGEEGRHLG